MRSVALGHGQRLCQPFLEAGTIRQSSKLIKKRQIIDAIFRVLTLCHILDDASSSTQWQYSYAEKWEDGSGVHERVTFDTEAKARQYFADNVPEVVELNKYRESVGDPDRLLPVLEKRRVVEPGDWLPLEAMTVDPVTGV